MSKANTTRTARNAVAVFAVALLCAAAMAVVLVDNDFESSATSTSGSGSSTGGGTEGGDTPAPEPPKTFTVSVSVTKGTGDSKTVTESKTTTPNTVTLTIKANTNYALPVKSAVTKSTFTGTFDKVDYEPNDKRNSATLKFTGVKSNVNGTVVCEKKIDVKQVVMKEDKVDTSNSKTLSGTFIQGDKVEGTFPVISGFDRPASIVVVYDGTQYPDLAKGYKQSTGKYEFTIPSSFELNETITVTAEYENTEYTFTSSILGGDVADKAKLKPIYNKPLVFKITVGAHYDLPDPKDVQVTNGSSKSYTYDATTGIVTIAKVVGNVSVTAKANAETFTVTYYDSDKKTVLDMEPSRFSYGIGCTLPANVVKTDYIFTGWVDAAGKPIAAVDKAWAPGEGEEGNVNVYATFKDDLSKYDVGDYQMPYLIAAILSMVALIAVPVIVKVRK